MKILFLCTRNSCRSQMAEGWTRKLKVDCIEPYSAGIETHRLNPYAVKVMKEAGVDISKQYSKLPIELHGIPPVPSYNIKRTPLRPGLPSFISYNLNATSPQCWQVF